MLWKLVIFVIVFALFLIFISFNLENKCNINFLGLKEFENVPVFLTVFISFFLGFLCSLPFIMKARMTNPTLKGKSSARTKKPKKEEPLPLAGELPKNSENKSPKDDNFKDSNSKEGSDVKV